MTTCHACGKSFPDEKIRWLWCCTDCWDLAFEASQKEADDGEQKERADGDGHGEVGV